MAAATQKYDPDSSHQPNPDTIPILDLSRFSEAKEFDDDFSKCVEEACEQGFFRVVNHGIPDELLDKATKICREVFKLPLPTKKKNISPIPYGGYFGGHPSVPFYESLAIARVPNPEAIGVFSDLMWPNGNENFCEITEEYTANLTELSKRIHEIFLRHWGVGKYYDAVFGHGCSIFRMNLYDAELASESVRLPLHTDLGSLSFLHEDEVGGLQVLNKAGNWVAVKSIPKTIVVLGGDSFQAWSNDRLRNVKHRVVVEGCQSRLVLCLFNHFPPDMVIKTPSELVDEEHPQRYKAFRFGDLTDFKLGDGSSCENPLETFAGMA